MKVKQLQPVTNEIINHSTPCHTIVAPKTLPVNITPINQTEPEIFAEKKPGEDIIQLQLKPEFGKTSVLLTKVLGNIDMVKEFDKCRKGT